MIEKDGDSAKLHQLQVIYLYKYNLNLLLGLFLRELDQHYEDNGLINKGMYDSRADCRTVDSVIVNMTQTEISVITRTILV